MVLVSIEVNIMYTKFLVHLIFSDDSVMEFDSPESAVDFLRSLESTLENSNGALSIDIPIQYSAMSSVSELQELTLANCLNSLQVVYLRSNEYGRFSPFTNH